MNTKLGLLTLAQKITIADKILKDVFGADAEIKKESTSRTEEVLYKILVDETTDDCREAYDEKLKVAFVRLFGEMSHEDSWSVHFMIWPRELEDLED